MCDFTIKATRHSPFKVLLNPKRVKEERIYKKRNVTKTRRKLLLFFTKPISEGKPSDLCRGVVSTLVNKFVGGGTEMEPIYPETSLR